ncbi:MAG: hypothetical protein Aurels2KO_54640 [Aureliella sp.]
MNSNHVQRAAFLFEQALDVPVRERATWLADQCQGDARLLDQVRELIDLQQEASGLFPLDSDRQSLDSEEQIESGSILGDFEIDSQVGSGAMGVVYRARQRSLNRVVALKVLPAHLRSSAGARQRFQVEIEAAARLQHPNIVQVYTTGSEGNALYYAMDYIKGQTLADVVRGLQLSPVAELEACRSTVPLKQQSTASQSNTAKWHHSAVKDGANIPEVELSPSHATNKVSTDWRRNLDIHSSYFDWIAGVVADVADGLHFAHSNSVLHRDIKPSNLLLGTDGVVRISDFGLARDLSEPGITQTGEIIGTPFYMAPEQLRSETAADCRIDIYALGATLYELLTLQPPFPGDSRDRVLARITQDEVQPVRRVNRRVPADLETICLKALEKDPRDRYGTADELAKDLRCYILREPIQARRASIVDRSIKWIDRHRPLAAAIAALPICVAIVAIAFAIRNHQLALDLQVETSRANLNVFDAKVEQARAIRASNAPKRRSRSLRSISVALDVLPRLNLPSEEITDRRLLLRNEAIASLAIPELVSHSAWEVANPWTPEVAFSPDYRLYAQPARTGEIRIGQQDNDQILLLSGASKPARQMKFSPDGRFLASKHYSRGPENDARVLVWRIDVREPGSVSEPMLELEDRRIFLRDFAFARTRPEFASVSPGVGIELYSLESGELLRTIPANLPSSGAIAFSTDDRIAVAANRERRLEIRESVGTMKTLESTDIDDPISAVGWSTPRNEVAVGTSAGTIEIWRDGLTSRPQVLRPHRREVTSVHFRPNTTLLASVSLTEEVQLTDISTSVSQAVSMDNERIQLVTNGFSSSGDLLGYQRVGRFGAWEIGSSVLRVLASDQKTKPVTFVRYHPQHPQLLLRSTHTHIEVWHTPSQSRVARLLINMHLNFQISADGKWLYACSRSDGISRWPLKVEPSSEDDQWLVEFGMREQLINGVYDSIVLHPTQPRLAATTLRESKQQLIVVLDARNGAQVRELDVDGRVSLVGFAPTANQVVFVPRATSRIMAWNVETGSLDDQGKFEASDFVLGDISQAGRELVLRAGPEIQFFDLENWKRVAAFTLESERTRSIKYSQDGRLAATTISATAIALIDCRSGAILAKLDGIDRDTATTMEFSPDGTEIAIAGTRNVYIWKLDNLKSKLKDFGLAWD